jgi:hypothetical protein
LSFRYALFLFLKLLLAGSFIILLRSSPLIPLGSCNHCNFACPFHLIILNILRRTMVHSKKWLNYISFEVMLPSACSFIVDGLTFSCRCSHYMFRPTWPSSGVYDISLFILKESVSLLLLPLLHVVILCTFSFVFLLCFR